MTEFFAAVAVRLTPDAAVVVAAAVRDALEMDELADAPDFNLTFEAAAGFATDARACDAAFAAAIRARL